MNSQLDCRVHQTFDFTPNQRVSRMEIDQTEYDAIAAEIHSDASPVGIDAKKTHILILHMLRDLQKRIAEIEKRLNENG